MRKEYYGEKCVEEEHLKIIDKLMDSENQMQEEISHLTSALARAHEALEYVDCQKFYTSCKEQKAKGKVFTSCHRCEALSDKSGTLALERWKAMEAVVEEAKKWRSKKYVCDRGYTFWVEFQYQERDLEKALEALDAKGERE